MLTKRPRMRMKFYNNVYNSYPKPTMSLNRNSNA